MHIPRDMNISNSEWDLNGKRKLLMWDHNRHTKVEKKESYKQGKDEILTSFWAAKWRPKEQGSNKLTPPKHDLEYKQQTKNQGRNPSGSLEFKGTCGRARDDTEKKMKQRF